MSSGPSGTFWGRSINHRFNQYRRGLAIKPIKHLMVITNDATGKISEIRYDFKKTIISKLRAEKYERIDKDTYIGAKDFIVIYKEFWGL